MNDKTVTGPRDRNQLNRTTCSRSGSNAAGTIYGIEPLICEKCSSCCVWEPFSPQRDLLWRFRNYLRRQVGTSGLLRDGASKMASLDGLTEDIAERFDLGLKAPALVQEVLGFISAQPGSIGGFLDKVKAAGLEEKAVSWLGSPYPM